MTREITFEDGRNADDFNDDVVRFAREVATDDAIQEANTVVRVTVREADTSVGAEVYVEERGNEGRWIDDSTVPPRMKGDGSPVSKRVQDLARQFFDSFGNYRVGQYEDDTCSETTITPVDLAGVPA